MIENALVGQNDSMVKKNFEDTNEMAKRNHQEEI